MVPSWTLSFFLKLPCWIAMLCIPLLWFQIHLFYSWSEVVLIWGWVHLYRKGCVRMMWSKLLCLWVLIHRNIWRSDNALTDMQTLKAKNLWRFTESLQSGQGYSLLAAVKTMQRPHEGDHLACQHQHCGSPSHALATWVFALQWQLVDRSWLAKLTLQRTGSQKGIPQLNLDFLSFSSPLPGTAVWLTYRRFGVCSFFTGLLRDVILDVIGLWNTIINYNAHSEPVLN